MRNILALLAVAVLCSGCALTSASINVPYQPLAQATPIAGTAAVTVSVATTDGRTEHRDRVSVKKNGYGMEMAPITASNDLPSTITAAFQQELTARGFKQGDGGASVNIELVQFYSDFKIGFFAGEADAIVAYNVSVKAANGSTTFSKYYEGDGTQPNIQIMDADNAQAALIKAFQQAVASTFGDPDFIKGVNQAGGAAAP